MTTRKEEIELQARKYILENHKEIFEFPSIKEREKCSNQIEQAYISAANWADEHAKCKWVSTKDRLPEAKKVMGNLVSEEVLIHTNRGCLVAKYYATKRAFCTSDSNPICLDVDYWMEIPALSKVETEEYDPWKDPVQAVYLANQMAADDIIDDIMCNKDNMNA